MKKMVHKANSRGIAEHGWLHSKHTFSFANYYNPERMAFGALRVINDDIIKAGGGFDTHPHRDMEIITWVLDGELEHKDSEGNRGLIYPGLAQRMSAGSGIWHSEKNWSHDVEVHFIQMWVVPDTESINPGYQQLDINDQLAQGGLVPVASGQGHDSAISIQQKDAVLWSGRLQPGETVNLPESPFAHVFSARGSVVLELAGELATGDAARLVNAGGQQITAGSEGAEILIWNTGSLR